jgi:hypothetical protein
MHEAPLHVVGILTFSSGVRSEIEHGCLIDFGSFSGLAQLVDYPVFSGTLEPRINAFLLSPAASAI